jgi:1-acyl-sn-glycerol-3-phosphate acyltransferase
VRFQLLSDIDTVRRGWPWGRVRPASWPEPAPGVSDRPSNLGWARAEPVRSLRWLIQRGVSLPFTKLMTDPQVEGREWLRQLDRPAILASNHVSHADTQILLYALPDGAREKTVVAAAADYWYRRPWLGRAVGLWLNTFPFSRTGGAREVLHSASELLKSGWNLLYYAEGTRSADGRLGKFMPGLGHLANQTRSPVVPMHIRGSHRVMPKGRAFPLPGPVEVRIGKPLSLQPGEDSRAFTGRVEHSVRELSGRSREPEVVGTWIERWEASRPTSRSRSARPRKT